MNAMFSRNESGLIGKQQQQQQKQLNINAFGPIKTNTKNAVING